MKIDFKTGTFYCGDCFDVMAGIEAGSVDMILNDPPYGTTQNKWDSVLPLPDMWAAYWRALKGHGAVVLTAQTPFDKVLGVSCLRHLKYEWIWEKPKATGHLNAKKQAMKSHENVLVFYRAQCTYNPQKTEGAPYRPNGGASKMDNYGSFKSSREGSEDGSRYPRSVFRFTHETSPLHPTQKPVALFKYLIRTYTNPGELVLDPTAGSGTTAIAAIQSGRRWICIERDQGYFEKACERVAKAEESAA